MGYGKFYYFIILNKLIYRYYRKLYVVTSSSISYLLISHFNSYVCR